MKLSILYETRIRPIALTVLTLLIIGYAIYSVSKNDLIEYKVTIIYCDSRPPKTIFIKAPEKPDNRQIMNYKQAIPSWRGELNVCELISTKLK